MPLTSIFGAKRGIPTTAANRLQRYALFLNGFDFDIKYVKSEQNNADFLSRLSIKENGESDSNFNYISYIKDNSELPIDVNSIKKAYANDKLLLKVKNFVKNGWPSNVKGDNEIKPYALRRYDLNLEDDILVLGYRIVIPESLRAHILNELHNTHLGIVKTKSLARAYVWWPSLNKDIESLIKNCSICKHTRSNPPKSPLQCWPIPEGVWARIHIDFLGPFQNKHFLIVTDAFSKWIEIFPMNKITSSYTIVKLRELFSRFGVPKTLVSDNGTQLTSTEFRFFLQSNGITLINSPPYHPASNGAAENSVKTVKQFLIKEALTNKHVDFDVAIPRFLINYRCAEHCSTGESPARLMLGRSLRTRLDLIKPNNVTRKCKTFDTAKSNMTSAQERNRRNYKGGRKIIFEVDQNVLVKDYRFVKPRWTPGKIVKRLGINMFVVKCGNFVWKRHTNQMLPDRSDIVFNVSEQENSEVEVSAKDSSDIKQEANNEISEQLVEDEETVEVTQNENVLDSDVSDVPIRPQRNRKPPNRFQS